MKKINKRWIFVIIGVIICAVAFLWSTLLYKVFSASDIKSEITGTLLGTIISAIVTVLLLQGQTEIEENKDISLNVFGKKQEVYHNFIEALESITQDGKVNVPSVEGHDKNAQDELQHLIYQLGFVQMHAEHDVAEKITELVGELLSSLSLMNSTDLNKNEAYSHLAKNVFDIVSLLRKDLYNNADMPVSEEKFKAAIRASGAFDKELLSDSGREEELSQFLKLLQDEFKERGRNPLVYYRSEQPRKTDEISAISRGYINVKTDRAILFNFPLEKKKKESLYFQFTFDDAGDYYAEIKDKARGENANDETAIKQYRELAPADPNINFLDTNIEGYKRFARMTENGKKNFVKNIVEGVEKKLAEVINSEQS